MTLKEFFKEDDSILPLVLLYFDDKGELTTVEVPKLKRRRVDNFLLKKEVVETKEEDDCKEVWLR